MQLQSLDFFSVFSIFMLAISTVILLIGVAIITVWMVSAWLARQVLITLPFYVYNAKATSFYSSCWNTGTNPDLVFAIVAPNSCLPDRHILEKFPRSQHQPLLITGPRFALSVPSIPVK